MIRTIPGLRLAQFSLSRLRAATDVWWVEAIELKVSPVLMVWRTTERESGDCKLVLDFDLDTTALFPELGLTGKWTYTARLPPRLSPRR